MLLMITANDIDIKPVLTYDLLTFTDMFAIDKYSGKLSLTGRLDYETQTSYNLSVMVIATATTTVLGVLLNFLQFEMSDSFFCPKTLFIYAKFGAENAHFGHI